MDLIESQILKQATKPASGIVSALLAPKVERIRSWAIEKELTSLMKDDSLFNLLENYTDRTLNKVAYLSTIVFTQEKVPLASVYEPINCISIGEDFDQKRNINKNFSIDINKQGECYFIIDDAGMGKSTFSKHICLDVFAKSDLIPIYFELSEFDSSKSVVENLATLFDDIDNTFSRALLSKLIITGKFFIVLDGFDETPKETQVAISKNIKDFNAKKGKSSLLITSRPKERIPDLVNSTILRLEKLTIDKALSIFKKYDLYADLSIGEQLIEEVQKIPDNFLETPLLVGLLYRTYGFNNSIADKISVFYSEIFEALYKGHDLTKSGFVREKISGLGIDKFKDYFQAFCFLFIISDQEEKASVESFVSLATSALDLCTLPPVVPRDFVYDLLEAVPLLTKDGNTYKFIHRSIAEYFAAGFVSKSDDKVALLEQLVKNERLFSETVEYIYEIDETLYRQTITAPIAKEFLKLVPQVKEPDLLTTVNFSGSSKISYWKVSDVTKSEDSRRIRPPKPKNFEIGSMSFMYGFIEGIEYVAVIALSRVKKHYIPDGAWDDLTGLQLGDEHGLDYQCVRSDTNLKELSEIIQPCQWYSTTSEEITKNAKLKVVQELLGRSQNRINHKKNSVRFLTYSRCHEINESLNRINNAKSKISDILTKRQK